MPTLGRFGAEGYETPHLNRVAREGMRFTDFYVGRSFCTPSRAALLTGCIPTRVGIGGNFGPSSKTGLSPEEMTIAEVLKQKNYATAIFGKWHLGHLDQFLPLNQGFDTFFGLPYSNDMWPYHPEQGTRFNFPDLPLYEGNRVIQSQVLPADQVGLTRKLTERAVDFIGKHKEQPFFIYLPHPQPHVPLFAEEAFQGQTVRGLYGDVVQEIDWSVGQILDAVQKAGLDEQTCIVLYHGQWPVVAVRRPCWVSETAARR